MLTMRRLFFEFKNLSQDATSSRLRRRILVYCSEVRRSNVAAYFNFFRRARTLGQKKRAHILPVIHPPKARFVHVMRGREENSFAAKVCELA